MGKKCTKNAPAFFLDNHSDDSWLNLQNKKVLSNPTPVYIFQKKKENTTSKRHMHPNVHSSTV